MEMKFAGWPVSRFTGLVFALLVTCHVSLVTAVSVWADEPSTAGDKAELQVLKARLEKLEQKIADQEATTSGAAPGTAIVQLPSGLHGVQMSGFVDTTFTYNLNNPQTRTNTLRVFDTQTNSFMINNAELVIEKPASSESPVGFKTSLMFGTDSEVVGGVTGGLGTSTASNDETEIQQAYAAAG